ncbi:hypothetical protein DBL02_12750 [Acinetobacter oleivorans]|uniref:hypothetical protein n=1 Tax=Acinetobacter oleivorans TaxID=1148157 RepID=UPI000D3211C4|nr:hypothetical protein [Acinetobacter oleivorans]PTV44549.1 hypothetical protein DBL02_12750 [Acinetobacter oleivorans]
MTLCVGGELDGQKVDKEVKIFKASEIDPSYTSTYYLQIYNRDNVMYQFWHPYGIDLHGLSTEVLEILRSAKS